MRRRALSRVPPALARAVPFRSQGSQGAGALLDIFRKGSVYSVSLKGVGRRAAVLCPFLKRGFYRARSCSRGAFLGVLPCALPLPGLFFPARVGEPLVCLIASIGGDRMPVYLRFSESLDKGIPAIVLVPRASYAGYAATGEAEVGGKFAICQSLAMEVGKDFLRFCHDGCSFFRVIGGVCSIPECAVPVCGSLHNSRVSGFHSRRVSTNSHAIHS